MAQQRTLEERLAAIEAKQEKLKAQQRKLKAQQSKKQRAARTKRLIELGATVENAVGHPITADNLNSFKKWLTNHYNHDFPKPTNQTENTPTPGDNT